MIVAPCLVIMMPTATNQSSTQAAGEASSVELEVEIEFTEEEERLNEEILEHPTRDDVHEQRERGQKCEGVVHAHCHPMR